jgi:uridine kinase
MAKNRVWIVTVGDERPIRDIARDLAEVGLSDVQILDAIGAITGSAEDRFVAQIRKVRGVLDVAPDVPIDIDPPVHERRGKKGQAQQGFWI